VKSLRSRCIELLTEIEARLDFEDEMPPLDPKMLVSKINSLRQEVQDALDTSNYDKLLQSGLQVFCFPCFVCMQSFTIKFERK
jgi:tRNA modification GTPase